MAPILGQVSSGLSRNGRDSRGPFISAANQFKLQDLDGGRDTREQPIINRKKKTINNKRNFHKS
uniref:Uncharacterized protein n=1 Tax=Anguilla anguilla TaxID=7936 RepID=A0A0E9PFX9_ANGAN